MRVIKMFVAGSIEGLDEERNKILQIVSARNAQYAQLNKDIFVLPISFKDFLIQSSQDFINKVIVEEADIVIFLFDAAKGEKCVGDYTAKEFEKAKEAHEARGLIYKAFLKKSRNARVDQEAEKALANHTSEDNFWQDPIYMDIVIGGAIEEALLHPRPNAPVASWSNDNFAYLTIEARFKEIFKGIFETSNKKAKRKARKKGSKSKTFEYSYNDFIRECYAQSQTKEDNPLALFARKEIEEILAKHRTYGIPNGELVRIIPFLDAEFYFYYYILLKFIEKQKFEKKTSYDPYDVKKRESDCKINESPLRQLLVDSYETATKGADESARWLLHCCLSSNSSDLSQLDVNKVLKSVQLALNDSDKFDKYINDIKDEDGIVHYIVDNSGIELYADILLGGYILNKTNITEINYHVKKVPIFVGDTTINDEAKIDDVSPVVDLLKDIDLFNDAIVDNSPHAYTYTVNGCKKTLRFTFEDTWSQPNEFDSSKEFEAWSKDENVKLIVLKGDMNYRRLVGDRLYDLGDTIEKKIRYVNRPILILRSFKSSVILDVEEKKQKRWKPNWRTCGEFGIIQFVKPQEEKAKKENED
ncbi:MAG: DUF89 family protein [Alistipes sp.]|nr:DUF89 family protein [Alistipes sp.]